MDLRAKIAEAMYQRPGSEYADSRRVDAVMEVIEEHEQQVQRLERLLGQLTKITEEHHRDLETAAADNDHIVISTKDSARAIRIRESIAAESMRERAADEVVRHQHGLIDDPEEAIRALPLLPEEDE